MSAVSLNNIVKKFGGFTAVHRMSMDIPDGSFVTLLGPSGCGKTTTLRMIAGLIDPSEGDITIKGQRINDVRSTGETLVSSSRTTRSFRTRRLPKMWLSA